MSTLFETHHEDAPLGMEGGTPEVSSKKEAERILEKADREAKKNAREAQEAAERGTLSLEHWARIRGDEKLLEAEMKQALKTGDGGPDRPYFEEDNKAAAELKAFLEYVEDGNITLLISPKVETRLRDQAISFLAAASMDAGQDGDRARSILIKFSETVLEMARGRDRRDHGFHDINAVSKAAGELRRAIKSYHPNASETESGEYLDTVSNALRIISENNSLYLNQPEGTPDPFAKVKSSKRKRK